MNDRQLMFVVKQIDKYNDDLKANSKRRKGNFLAMLISAAMTYVCFKGLPIDLGTLNELLSKIDENVRDFCGFSTGAYSVLSAIDLFPDFCEMVGLKSAISTLEYRLCHEDSEDNEDNKSR